MNPSNEKTVIPTEAARAGSEEGVVRYVLGISLTLAILSLSITWISAAAALT